MGLTIVAFLAVPAFLLNFAFARTRGRGTTAGRVVEALNLLLAAFALLQGFEFLIAFPDAGSLPLYVDRISLVFLVAAHALLVLLALEFPAQASRAARIAVGMAVAAASAFAGYFILTSYNVVADLVRKGVETIRLTGPYFLPFIHAQALLALAASVLLAIRGLADRSRIQRQRSAVVLFGVIAGAALIWFLSGALPSRSGVSETYVLAPLAALLLASTATYGFYLSRLFDWRTIGRTVFAYCLLILVVGVPTGAALAFLVFLRVVSPLVPIIGTPLLFLIAYSQALRFVRRFLARSLSRGDYREDLESALSHVDLSSGRDEVLSELYRLLSGALDFIDFTVIIEDDRGTLRSVYSPTGAKAVIDRGGSLAEALEASRSTVLLKSEAIADPANAAMRGELLGLFESLRAEALILVREGRRIIGIFSLGPRRTGAEYTYYDYDTFRSIYGKLFVFAYYLKNVARESIIRTVDRELALSDQIIRFALEKIDVLDSPKVDAAWAMRSSRRLGGDFIDFVRLSQERWFFVMGDVSGKGLSAAMNMLILKSMIRTFLRIEKDFVGLVSRVNLFIKDNLPRGSFFAGVFGYFDLAKESFYYINCGIPAMLFYSPSFETFIEVQGEGKVLGFVRDISKSLKPRKLSLPPGSALVAATDGITECESLRGERFGKERLRRSVAARLGSGARGAADGVIADLLQFTDQRQEDDITLLVMKFLSRRTQ
ncbi:MAG TPA: PP2C family protein-serine/threonine phosphatase [Rectinemataceae bacterium]|nr:PP2C family protein-serine/threonine phosphatase [Rectinemataceae bacterium]